MNGAEFLMRTAGKASIEVCFTNFGTTEVPLAVAFDCEPGIKPVLCLAEAVCTGAADGWGRMKDKPAMTLLHLGPGLANGISNLHDAHRALTPLVNVVGDHMSWHVGADPPLAMNIEALASVVSQWYRTVKTPGEISRDLVEAITSAMYGQISTLIVPHDFQMAAILGQGIASQQFYFDAIDDRSIQKAATLMRSRHKMALILGGRALRRQGLQAAARIKAATKCDLLVDVFPGYLDRGGELPEVKRIPYFPEQAAEFLAQYEAFVMAGSRTPVSFFGNEGVPSYLIGENQPAVKINNNKQNPIEALEYLADTLKAPQKLASAAIVDPPPPKGDLTAEKACQTLAAVQPENAIIVDEGLSSAFPCYAAAKQAPPHTLLTIAGGSLGYGMPCSIGAAVACPDRPVINYQADGSAMYTVQALWTQAREKLNITTLITSNRDYHILKIEMERANVSPIGPNAESLMDLDNPKVNWVKIAEGLGVPAVSVTTSEDLTREIKRSVAEPGPHLIEMVFS